MRILVLAGVFVGLAAAQHTGTAVYYADHFHGKLVASGEKYDKNAYTAAHNSLAFGTKLEVRNLENGKTVEVRVNDRMGKNSKRLIDLSRAAAEEIGLVEAGRARVRIRVLERGDGGGRVRTRKAAAVSDKPTPFRKR